MNKKRLVVFDLLKIILSFLVVNLHVESFITGAPFSPLYFLGWYAVPIFVTLSFYFGAKIYLVDESQPREFMKKLSRFIIPLLFWSVIGFIIHPELNTLKYFFRQLLTGTAVDPPLYYLSAIIVVSGLIYMFRKYLLISKYHLALTIIILLTIEATGLEMTISHMIPIQIQLASIRVFEFTKYALLGVSLYTLREKISSLNYHFTMGLLSTLAVFANIYYLWRFQVGDLSYGGVVQFVVITTIMITALIFSNVNFNPILDQLISKFGGLTLGVYCIHTFFLEKITSTYPHFILSLTIYILSLFVSLIIQNIWNGKLKAVVS